MAGPSASLLYGNTVADGPWLGALIVVPLTFWPAGIIGVLVASAFFGYLRLPGVPALNS
jgi:hypothetical protein